MEQYNKLSVVEHICRPPNETRYRSWNSDDWVVCICECGNKITVPYYGVKNGLIKSCKECRRITARKTLEITKQHNCYKGKQITYNDNTMNITEWSKEIGIPRSTLSHKLNIGIPIEEIIKHRGKKHE